MLLVATRVCSIHFLQLLGCLEMIIIVVCAVVIGVLLSLTDWRDLLPQNRQFAVVVKIHLLAQWSLVSILER